VNNILDSKYKTGGYEQARNANFRQLNQDVSSGTPFGNKYFYGYGRTICLFSISILILNGGGMKSTNSRFYFNGR
jgi:hypothetical protein